MADIQLPSRIALPFNVDVLVIHYFFFTRFQTSSLVPVFKPVGDSTASEVGKNSATSDASEISGGSEVSEISGGSEVSRTSAPSEISQKSAVSPVIRKSDPVVSTNQVDLNGNLHHVFRRRREHLLEGCRRLNTSSDLPAAAWLTFLVIEAPGPLKVCVPTKVR